MKNSHQSAATARDWATSLRTGTGRGVRIGMLDTGVDSDHPDLAGRIAANYEARVDVEHGRVVEVSRGTDHGEHGTACAGILTSLAPDAELHSVQIVGVHPRDSPLKLVAGLRFAVEQRWGIITINAGTEREHPGLRALVNEAWANGQIVIAAVDNRPEVIGYPAAYPNVLAVDMEHFEEPLEFRFHPDAEVEVEAKGIYVEAPCAGGGRRFYTGSSFAAPHVAAMAARLKEGVPELNGAILRDAFTLLSTDGVRDKRM